MSGHSRGSTNEKGTSARVSSGFSRSEPMLAELD